MGRAGHGLVKTREQGGGKSPAQGWRNGSGSTTFTGGPIDLSAFSRASRVVTGDGDLIAATDVIGNRWGDFIESAESAHEGMRASAPAIEKQLATLNRSVRDYEVRRICSIQRAMEIAEEHHGGIQNTAVAGRNTGYDNELPVQSSDGQVRVSIDDGCSRDSRKRVHRT